MSFHNSQIRNHIPHNWTFADSTAREDTTDPNSGLGYASADLYKLARQTDDDSLWMLTAVTPTWQNVSGGSSTATVPTAVEGSVLIGDSTPEWALLDASADTKILVGNGTTLTSQALSGDVTMTNAGAITIANDAVTLAKLANVTRGSLIVGGASDAPTLLSGKTLGAILIGDGTDITSTTNPSIAGNVGIGGTLTVNTDDLVVNGTGVGIGTTPTAKLDVVAEFEKESANQYGLKTAVTYNPDSEESIYAVFGASTQAIKDGANNLVSASAGLRGLQSSVLNLGAGNINSVAGIMSIVQNAGTGTISTGWAGYLFSPTAAVANPITTAGGLYIGAQKVTGVTTGYGIYCAGASDINYFAGNVGIGETTIPTGAKLAVGGGIAVTNGVGGSLIILTSTGGINAPNLPTSSSGLSSGDIYRDGSGANATLKIV